MRVLVLVICPIVLFGQQVGQNTAPGASTGTATFQASTQLVVEAVVVKDKGGKSIEGLTAQNFTITEDGAPQEIKFFEVQKLDETIAPLAAVTAPAIPVREIHTRTSCAGSSGQCELSR